MLSDPRLNSVPGAAIYERVLLQLRSRRQCLVGKVRVDVVEEGKGVGPRCLANGGPDGGFFDVGGGFVVPREEAHGVVGGDGGDEQLGEERFDGGGWGDGEICRVGFRSFRCPGEIRAFRAIMAIRRCAYRQAESDLATHKRACLRCPVLSRFAPQPRCM